jgi:SAM-dependent methyltransferase
VWQAEFRDERLVEVYDAECPWGRDDDWFVSVVGPPPARVLDLGCGTGRLTIGLAGAGHALTGVDPAGASLDAARRKSGAERVTWIEGTSADLATGAFDAAVMTSHVAQLFIDDEEWRRTLVHLRQALITGGRLAFDTRDPQARGWERWNPADSFREVTLPDGDVVRVWTQVTAVEGPTVVRFTRHYAFLDGTELVSDLALRFRSEAEVRTSLDEAGFTVDHIAGGWDGQLIGHADGELLVVARAT